MFENDTLEELKFLIENGSEFESGKAHEELASRGLIYEDGELVAPEAMD